MKKLFAITLCTFIIVCAALPIGATCAHSYTEEHVEATCISRAYTIYTCENCGDTYTVYDRLYTAPDSCHMVLEGDRNGDVLTVTVSLYNNPGFWANRLTLYYSSEALEAVSAENGNVWGSSALTTINSTNNNGGPYVRFYCQNSQDNNNTSNGVVYRVSFKIKDVVDNWGIRLEARALDNIDYDHNSVPFQIINTVTLGYGEHSYEYDSTITSPTYDNEGADLHRCYLCSETKTVTIPPLPKGDINGDGVLDMRDSLEFKHHIADITTYETYIPHMDLNDDGKTNAKDLLIMKKIIAGV